MSSLGGNAAAPTWYLLRSAGELRPRDLPGAREHLSTLAGRSLNWGINARGHTGVCHRCRQHPSGSNPFQARWLGLTPKAQVLAGLAIHGQRGPTPIPTSQPVTCRDLCSGGGLCSRGGRQARILARIKCCCAWAAGGEGLPASPGPQSCSQTLSLNAATPSGSQHFQGSASHRTVGQEETGKGQAVGDPFL